VENVDAGGFAGRQADVRPRAGRPPLSDGWLVGRGIEDPSGDELADRVLGSALVAARAPARADSVPRHRVDGQDSPVPASGIEGGRQEVGAMFARRDWRFLTQACRASGSQRVTGGSSGANGTSTN